MGRKTKANFSDLYSSNRHNPYDLCPLPLEPKAPANCTLLSGVAWSLEDATGAGGNEATRGAAVGHGDKVAILPELATVTSRWRQRITLDAVLQQLSGLLSEQLVSHRACCFSDQTTSYFTKN